MSMFGGQFGQNQRVNPLDYSAQAGSPALISFFNAVYGWMAAGLALTAVVTASVVSGVISETDPTNVVLPTPKPPATTILADVIAAAGVRRAYRA